MKGVLDLFLLTETDLQRSKASAKTKGRHVLRIIRRDEMPVPADRCCNCAGVLPVFDFTPYSSFATSASMPEEQTPQPLNLDSQNTSLLEYPWELKANLWEHIGSIKGDIRLMDKILHYFKYPTLWELWVMQDFVHQP